jgi:two-component system sensor histidine kinase BaeS
MKIFTKLILILLFTSLLLLTVIYAAVQWSFDRGMLEYVNNKELASLQIFSKNLALYYQQEQSWDALIDRKRLDRRPPPHLQGRPFPPSKRDKRAKTQPSQQWHQIVKLSDAGVEFPADVRQYLQQNNDFRQPRNRPPEHLNSPRRLRPEDRGKLPPNNEVKRHPTLLSADKTMVIGPFNEEFSLQEIQLNNEIIGYLALPPKTALTDTFDLAFLAQTKEDLFYIVLALFILIIIIAIQVNGL